MTDVSLESPVINFVPTLKDKYYCERIHVMGTSRFNMKYYASAVHVTLKASEDIPEKFLQKIEIHSHRNASSGLCQFESEDWKTFEKGQWNTAVSPYESKYFDVRVNGQLPAAVTLTVDEDFQLWRLICLGFGILLLALAPIVSTWVPFYVCGSMAIGVLGVAVVLAFQLMRLLPMGRKNILYITLYGSLLGVGSYITHYFSSVVNSVLVNFGMSEDMHYPVSVFLLVLIILIGAALGYWFVRKFIISKDGNVDATVAQFVKWAMFIFGLVFVLQSSVDILLPFVVLGIYLSTCYLGRQRFSQRQHERMRNSLWQSRSVHKRGSSGKRAEFLSRSTNNVSGRRFWNSPTTLFSLSNSNERANAYLPRKQEQENYYSTFHKTPRRKYTKTQWDDFTRESTREALADWAATPEVVQWIADNATRLQRRDPDELSDDCMESTSNSSDETMAESSSGGIAGFFRWR